MTSHFRFLSLKSFKKLCTLGFYNLKNFALWHFLVKFKFTYKGIKYIITFIKELNKFKFKVYIVYIMHKIYIIIVNLYLLYINDKALIIIFYYIIL